MASCSAQRLIEQEVVAFEDMASLANLSTEFGVRTCESTEGFL